MIPSNLKNFLLVACSKIDSNAIRRTINQSFSNAETTHLYNIERTICFKGATRRGREYDGFTRYRATEGKRHLLKANRAYNGEWLYSVRLRGRFIVFSARRYN